jgi:phthiocerol/phenolphthiocerol synthesis type-I polyketide synthase E
MSTTEISDTLAAIWKEQLGTDPATADDDFVASGGTSIGAVHLAAAIQERIGVAVDAIEILERGTFGRISELVVERSLAKA